MYILHGKTQKISSSTMKLRPSSEIYVNTGTFGHHILTLTGEFIKLVVHMWTLSIMDETGHGILQIFL